MLNFFPASDYNSNTALMDTTLGLTGDSFDTFESTTLIPGLTITLSGGGVATTTWTSLPALFSENACPPFQQNDAWDGTNVATSDGGNAPNSCSSPSNIAKTATFDYAPGTRSFGIGLSNFQSLNSPQFPITNHELFVNGIDEGVIERLAGGSWTPGLPRNAYLRIDGTNGTTISSVEFENLTGADSLLFDHLAVAPAPAPVPEPSSPILVVLILGIPAALRKSRMLRSRGGSGQLPD